MFYEQHHAATEPVGDLDEFLNRYRAKVNINISCNILHLPYFSRDLLTTKQVQAVVKHRMRHPANQKWYLRKYLSISQFIIKDEQSEAEEPKKKKKKRVLSSDSD